MHLARMHRKPCDRVLTGSRDFSQTLAFSGEDLAEKGKFVVRGKGLNQSKIIFIVIITGINNMCLEFFWILDLVFMFLTTLGG